MNYDHSFRLELEKILISSIINLDRDLKMKEIFLSHGITNPNYFFLETHRKVYKIILENWEKNIPNDLVTICSNRTILLSDDFKYFLSELPNQVYHDDHIEHHLWVFKEFILVHFWRHNAHVLINEFIDHKNILEISDQIISSYNNLYENLTKNHRKDELEDLKSALESDYKKILNGESISVKTGMSEYDEFTDGLQKGELTILAARPGMGKTTVAIILSYTMSFVLGYKGLFVSLEMSRRQLVNKIVSQKTGIDYQKIRRLKLTNEEYFTIQDWYRKFEENKNLVIVDNVHSFSQIIDMIDKGNYDYCFIDYLQLMKLEDGVKKRLGNREQEVAEFSRNLKLTAKRNEIPIVALSQLSRAVEQRGNKRPMLSDLRESGAIEQDADNVWFLYRDAYYRKSQGEIVLDHEEGNMELNLAKGRETGTKNFLLNVDFKKYKITSGFKLGDF